MNNPSGEQISALVDGELDEHDRHAAVDVLLDSDDIRNTWGRYHLIRDSLTRNLPSGLDSDFSSRVMQALENEPTVLAPPRVHSTLGRRLAGLAVAASVAAVAVMGVQFMYQQDAGAPAAQVAQTSAGAFSSPQQNLARATIRPSLQPNIRPNIQTVTQAIGQGSSGPALVKNFNPRLNRYLVDHNQFASGATVQGVTPYARIVASPNTHYILIPAQK